ncbi:type I secretion system permease/ATPase [Lichenibacterium minor]|uniref:Type I secretion system permease/ATPase n=1 Tax=Lichenibacterium minor TaxID=2316528 RepID=A0A4Q2UBU5_9HYPH|nr:type I secretion system permease/ATPase [Lichenibacterium minor]RYC32647.1 type I secretion system permease/ATPase [Lichenibacterium minor]
MTQAAAAPMTPAPRPDAGLRALCGIAAYYRIAADPTHLQRELALVGREAGITDLMRASGIVGLKARRVTRTTEKQLVATPTPAIAKLRDGGFVVFGGRLPDGRFRLVDPVTSIDRAVSAEEFFAALEPQLLLVGRKVGGAGYDPKSFGFRWFLPSIWRYRRPLTHVLLASLFVQVFALVTPLFFQVVVDKVLSHKGYSTLIVLTVGIVLVGLFDVVLQYLRTYALTHTTNRIDVELGQRLFRHLLHLPLSYFETRAAGQTVARVRELENVRAFLTGQGLFSALDLVFTFVFIGVLFAYSWKLTIVVVLSIPLYMLVALGFRPILQEMVREKFNASAVSQQFLVEAVVGIQTVKASAVEPIMQSQWEERLASYVKQSFSVTIVSALAQNGVTYISRLVTALLMLFGAKAVIDGQLSIGALVAFNMISAQVTAPVLRLSQLYQDFQQVQISVERLGDVLNAPAEPVIQARTVLPPPRGLIEFRNVTFRYRPGSNDVVKAVNLQIRPGEVVGIVGPSGSGKSTLTKLVQRLYMPQDGQILLDGADLTQVDPAWLRTNIGVVLQENLLFNRTIHENIAFAAPAMPRAQVIAIAKLSGADEFIAKLPGGYDTLIEERGANLSGGQRQRIAIARALATNPPILIFDEATSALDYESERVIQNNMRQIVRNRTVIIIAHRLAAVRPCDRIIGMEDGRVIEVGAHDELIARQDGLYRKLWALQNEQVQA